MPNIRNEGSFRQVPYVKELERVALNLLRKNPNNKEKLKEILDEYASRYAREHNIRT